MGNYRSILLYGGEQGDDIAAVGYYQVVVFKTTGWVVVKEILSVKDSAIIGSRYEILPGLAVLFTEFVNIHVMLSIAIRA